MDRKIEKKKWNNKRLVVFIGSVVFIILIGFIIRYTLGKSKLTVYLDRLTINEVKYGPFQEFIPVNGTILPVTTIYLDAVEGGRVEEKYAEDGANLKKGDPILKLANADLELNLANQETAVYAEQTQMQISQNAAQQNTISKLNQMADVDVAYKEAERVYKLNKSLFEKRVVGSQEYLIANNNYNYQINKHKLALQVLKQDTTLRKQQFEQTKEQIAQMKKTLALMRKKVAELMVRAPIDGQLTSMDVEVGQNKNKGEHLGQMDVLSGYKVRLNIDEHYISHISPGLKGDFTFGDKIYDLVVKKVYTQVKDGGSFQVDMSFIGQVPKQIRKGQNLQIRLYFSDVAKALLLPRGGFYQQTGGAWIFKISEDGKSAFRVSIELNRQNPNYYEVTSGLQPGDKVITSSYDTYRSIQELILKK